MVVYRMKDGGLWIHSAVALEEKAMERLESFGEPKVLVVPNRLHRLDAVVYKERYPKLVVCCPAAAREAVSQKLKVDGTCEEILPPLGIGVLRPEGLKAVECTYVLTVGDGRALVFCDALFHLPHLPGIDGLLIRLVGSSGFFGMTLIGRLLMLKDRERFQNWLREVAETPSLEAISMAHGNVITNFCRERLVEAADGL